MHGNSESCCAIAFSLAGCARTSPQKEKGPARCTRGPLHAGPWFGWLSDQAFSDQCDARFEVPRQMAAAAANRRLAEMISAACAPAMKASA